MNNNCLHEKMDASYNPLVNIRYSFTYLFLVVFTFLVGNIKSPNDHFPDYRHVLLVGMVAGQPVYHSKEKLPEVCVACYILMYCIFRSTDQVNQFFPGYGHSV